ncbi:hypothetical protein HPB49_000229 [Dermacentor silvarum]|uniref:Uncharacterized protein n=1 Tax=Dermacentor silvarum TaxID=543639 RepID=A0ACB8D155_DERSI|nr:hypothetical protein HPB49_000229 [Dermacentor silvarum]
MSHVLVKWAEENKWDIYPITCITDVAVGYRLFTQENAMDDLRGTTHMCKWKEGEDAAPAELLEIGTQRALERKRARLVAAVVGDDIAAASDCPSDQRSDGYLSADEGERACTTCDTLRKEVAALKRRNEELEELHECHKMVKKLKKMIEKGEGRGGHVKPCPKVDIGGEVVVEEAIIHGLRRNCAGAPAKFARGLMWHLFTAEELRGKSLFGRRLHCRRIPGGSNDVEEQPFITAFYRAKIAGNAAKLNLPHRSPSEDASGHCYLSSEDPEGLAPSVDLSPKTSAWGFRLPTTSSMQAPSSKTLCLPAVATLSLVTCRRPT